MRAGRKQSDRQGYVYVLTNPAMPGVVKIGRTGRDLRTRLKELSSASGVPVPFRMAGAVKAADAAAAEREIHERLEHCRVSRRREFFRCGVEEAMREARRVAEAPGRSFVRGRAEGGRKASRKLPPFTASAAAALAGWSWLAPYEPGLSWAWAVACGVSVLTGRLRLLAEGLSLPSAFGWPGVAATLAAAAAPPLLGLSWEPALSLLPMP